jgi:hypothetical protein
VQSERDKSAAQADFPDCYSRERPRPAPGRRPPVTRTPKAPEIRLDPQEPDTRPARAEMTNFDLLQRAA